MEIGWASCSGICRRVSDVGLTVGRQRRRACPALPQDFVGRCEALAATLVLVPNPAREKLCAIFCDGLEVMLDGDEELEQDRAVHSPAPSWNCSKGGQSDV